MRHPAVRRDLPEEFAGAGLARTSSSAAASAAFPCTPQSLIDTLFVAADAFAGGAKQHDDMTVVVVRMK